MTSILTEIKDDAEAIIDKIEGNSTVEAVETKVEAAGSATLNFIKSNSLEYLYQIALTIVAAMAPGASWTATLASIEAQAVADGKQLVTGATAIVASMAQADLIAAGKLLAPVVAPAPTSAPTA